MGTSDGAVLGRGGAMEAVEVKGCRVRKGRRKIFRLSDIRVDGSDFEHLFAVVRTADPTDWTDVGEYSRCGFRLAHVRRRDLLTAMETASPPRDPAKLQNATITQGSNASWLGGYMRWVDFDDLNLEWWWEHVLGEAPSKLSSM